MRRPIDAKNLSSPLPSMNKVMTRRVAIGRIKTCNQEEGVCTGTEVLVVGFGKMSCFSHARILHWRKEHSEQNSEKCFHREDIGVASGYLLNVDASLVGNLNVGAWGADTFSLAMVNGTSVDVATARLSLVFTRSTDYTPSEFHQH